MKNLLKKLCRIVIASLITMPIYSIICRSAYNFSNHDGLTTVILSILFSAITAFMLILISRIKPAYLKRSSDETFDFGIMSVLRGEWVTLAMIMAINLICWLILDDIIPAHTIFGYACLIFGPMNLIHTVIPSIFGYLVGALVTCTFYLVGQAFLVWRDHRNCSK